MRTKKNVRRSWVIMILLILLDVYAMPDVQTEEIKNALFNEANTAYNAARQAKAEILAPKSFAQGIEAYQKAADDFRNEKKLEDIKKKLDAAFVFFQKAVEAARLAEVAFGQPIQARVDAMTAEAPRAAAELWRLAEEKFNQATKTLEEGDVKKGKEQATEAEKMYREAELQAIKMNYLVETYQLLQEADALKAKDYAPKTLQNAQMLVKSAEKELSENRYDTDVAQDYARQAKREAQHAVYLATTIKNKKHSEQTFEDLMLQSEQPLIEIATSMEITPSFESGVDKPTREIVRKISAYQKTMAEQKDDLFDAQQRNALLEARNSELEEKLGGIEQEKTVLQKRLKEQEKIKQLYSQIENMFTTSEAFIFREGNTIHIRLLGLSFPVAKATISPGNNIFLDKIIKAIQVFQSAALTVEGHTDSHGSDEANLRLSVDRAEAVRRYLIENSSIEPSRLKAIGYGESKPIASNETVAGRTRNRRIEIGIVPNLVDIY